MLAFLQSTLIRCCAQATAGYGEDKSSIPSSRGASGSSSQEATSQPADHPSLEGQEPLEDAETPFSDDADDAAASLQHPQGADSAALKGDAAAPAAKGESDDGEDEAAFAQPPQPLQAEAEEAATLDSWNASPSLSAFFTEFKRSSPQKQKCACPGSACLCTVISDACSIPLHSIKWHLHWDG